MGYVFISHVHEDAEPARTVAAGLEAAGYTTWYYERDTRLGRPYLDQILDAIAHSTVIIVLVSRDSLGSWQVDREMIQAYESDKAFMPLLLGLTHEQFRNGRRNWAMMFGAAVTLSIPARDIADSLPRIIEGVQGLEQGNDADVVGAAGARGSAARPTVSVAAPRRGRLFPLFGIPLAAVLIAVGITVWPRSATPWVRRVILKDNFANPSLSGLTKISPDPRDYAMGIAAGQFYIRQINPNLRFRGYQNFAGYGDLSDSAISLDVYLRGATEGHFAMLNCRASANLADGYWFKLYPAQQYAELVRMDSNHQTVLRGEYAAVIHPANASNHIELICHGTTISARINGRQVVSAQDHTYTTGVMALGAGTDDGVHTTVDARFGNLELDKID